MTLFSPLIRHHNRSPSVKWAPCAWAAVLLLGSYCESNHAQGLRLSTSINLAADYAVTSTEFNILNSIVLFPEPLILNLATRLKPHPRGSTTKDLPVFLDADQLVGQGRDLTVAKGQARLRQGNTTIRAEILSYTSSDNMAFANGQVRIDRAGDVYTGPYAQFQLERSEGFFMQPQYYFARTGAGGWAEQIDFIDDQHAIAYGATYSSCLPDEKGQLAWVLTTSKVSMDFSKNEGVAHNAVVRFKGVPILAAPVLSFPLTSERKSGWLPPTFEQNSRSGFVYTQPYYWNIAPNYDMTLAPTSSSRRGFGIDSEFRYLGPTYVGQINYKYLPHDRALDLSRWLANAQHEWSTFDASRTFGWHVLRASDHDYWKDFPRDHPGLTKRLLSNTVHYDQHFDPRATWLGKLGMLDFHWYARIQNWQVLQDREDSSNHIYGPYRRSPQIGFSFFGQSRSGFEWSWDNQVNRFTPLDNHYQKDRDNTVDQRYTNKATRLHSVGYLQYVWQPLSDTRGWLITPRLTMYGTHYALDQPLENGHKRAGHVIPTFSLDSAWTFERNAHWFQRSFIQTLEPRLHYVRTPYVNQAKLPFFDTAPIDFNFDSIYSDNPFSGVDRVADNNQLTAGISTRLIDPHNGAETLRLGMVQRYQFSNQLVTPDNQPITDRFSNLLLLASTSVIPSWFLDTNMEYSAEKHQVKRVAAGVRFAPGPWRTIGINYRLARQVSEQVDLAWQWPIAGKVPPSERLLEQMQASLGPANAARQGSGSCNQSGTFYSVGRVSYNLRDTRLTNSLLGFEYDAGCWIGRLVTERVSINNRHATTRVMFQLELVGLSRLGSSPLRSLRDSIPGYRLLRNERALLGSPESPEPLTRN